MVKPYADGIHPFKFDPQLDPDEQELRIMYASARFRDWALGTLPGLETIHADQSITPEGQFAALAADFGSGLPLTFKDQFKPFHARPIDPMGDGVWYLKTSDLRIFGWFPRQDCFVAVVADTMEHVKTHDLYQGYRGEVVRFRGHLPLDEPKFVPGENPNAVISNYTYP